ncbi:hypothetical protein [Sporosalibacterium faouarense]|uniref:hypothetical protein n=1 Tax=Sporosalibacterium faouarense TaxID=516123 RepID=UPI00192C2291|nr:hypothetical protein [Sporosalibacterium faouarense]
MKYFNILYNSFLWGIIFSVLAFQNKWLEMRINIGIIIPITIIIAFIVFILFEKINRFNIDEILSFKFAFINTILMIVFTIIIIGIERTKILPAAIIRELLGMTKVSFSRINMVIISIIILGLVIIGFSRNKK